jgi:hypothetical protein
LANARSKVVFQTTYDDARVFAREFGRSVTDEDFMALGRFEAIQAHLAFLARRRSLRPSEEYRVPTDEEWTEFLGHFARSPPAPAAARSAPRASTSTAAFTAAFTGPRPPSGPASPRSATTSSPAPPKPNRRGWHGEAEGLKISLAGARDKLAQIDRRSAHAGPVTLGMPAFASAVPRTGEQK